MANPTAPSPPKRWTRSLYAQVLVGVLAGALVGHLWPAFGQQLKPLGDAFIKLVKMLIAPIIFCTVVTGIVSVGDLRKVGRVGLKALVYFEVVTTMALLLGLMVGKVIAPGSGIHADPSTLDAKAVEGYAQAGHSLSGIDLLLNVIPSTLGEAFAKGEVLQILLVALLFGVALSALGPSGQTLHTLIEKLGQVLFRIVGLVMRLAPLGAFGAIAFTVGKYGIGTLAGLGKLMACFYLTSALFVLVALGGVLQWVGVGLFPLIRYLKEELLIVLGTSSSESALPQVMEKLEAAGCERSVVGLVIPMGYSFNLDGTSIYLTLAMLFVAQATGVQLSLSEELGLLAVLLLTSKGAAAVTGGGFITLAATLSVTGKIPVAGIVLLLGVDRFMSEARALTNLMGNAVATLAIAKSEGALDLAQARAALSGSRVKEPVSGPSV